MGQGFFLRVQGLDFVSNMFPRKLAMVCAKGTLDSSEEGSFCEVILDNAQIYTYMGVCQNCDPILGTLNIRCRSIIGMQKGTIILTATHI